ncbi:MAG: phage tail protein [Nannocystaceae bacterium]
MSTATQLADYPVMAYNFRVTIGSSTASFAEVSGLKREFETVTYRHGLSFREGEDITKYYLAKYESITLRRGVFRGAASLYEWVSAKEDRALTINLCDALGDPVIEWKIARAVVKKIDAPSFDAKAGEVAVETLEVMAAGISLHEIPQVES